MDFLKYRQIGSLLLFAAVALAAAEVRADDTTCTARFLMDVESGEVILEENAHKKLPPASMVKMMTVYLAMKRVRDGVAALSDMITVSGQVSKIGGSQVYLKHGEEFTLEQLIEAVMIQSANDAAAAIAEYLGGSIDGFVDMMNEEAKRLGMKEAEFHSPHGLPPGRGQEPDLISAHDLAVLGRAIVRDFPQLIELSKKPEGMFRDGTFKMTNTNKLIHRYKGADGIKTGYYHKAGFCITASAKRHGVRMIAVVMGCKTGRERFTEASRLLSRGFSKYKIATFIKKGDPARSKVALRWGEKKSIIPVAADEVRVSVRIDDAKKVMREEYFLGGLKAPLTPETPCGKIVFKLGDRVLGETKLVAGEGVAELGWFGKLMRLLKLK